MLWSSRHRFLFIHVPKAAGTSIQDSLRPFAEPTDRSPLRWIKRCCQPFIPPRHRVFREHASAQDVRRGLPRDLFDGAFKFAFVRNPWDAVVSRYSYLLRTPSHRHHRLVKDMGGLEPYVNFEMNRGGHLQVGLLADRDGRLLVDFVGRFETLADDFGEVCNHIGVKATLPHTNSSTHRDYRDYYTPTLALQVGEWLSDDIERFAYTFDGVSEAQGTQARLTRA